jgi:hypothetical protein
VRTHLAIVVESFMAERRIEGIEELAAGMRAATGGYPFTTEEVQRFLHDPLEAYPLYLSSIIKTLALDAGEKDRLWLALDMDLGVLSVPSYPPPL